MKYLNISHLSKSLSHLTVDGIAEVLLGHPDARRSEEDEDGDAVVHPANKVSSFISQIRPICELSPITHNPS